MVIPHFADSDIRYMECFVALVFSMFSQFVLDLGQDLTSGFTKDMRTWKMADYTVKFWMWPRLYEHVLQLGIDV
jgi:hypothetical protein